MLDTVHKFETPEGVDLDVHIAGPVPRACAWLIDALIRVGVYWILGIITSFMGGLGFGIWAICVFFMEWFYPVIFEVLSGATPGKKMMSLTVVQDDGTPVNVMGSLLRNLLWPADFFPVFYFTGLISMTLNSQFKRLGDLVAGTQVVYLRSGTESHISIPERDPVALPLPLLSTEKFSILDFAERTENFSEERQIELTNLLKGYTGASEHVGLSRVIGYANWLLRGSEK